MKFFKNLFIKYYKTAIQMIFKIIYGRIKTVLEPKNQKDIIVKNLDLDEINYKIYICRNSSLYTDTIHDTAIIKNRQIIKGPSFQYRLNKNVNCELNSVLTKGTPRLKRKIKGMVFSLLTGGGGNFNYWHWLFDVLPRINMIEKLNLKSSIDYYLFPNLEKKFQIQTLDLMNIPQHKRLSSKKFRHLCADDIIVASHPYTILNDPSLDSLNIPLWITNYLKFLFLENAIKNTKIKSFPKKLYINRQDSTSLRYIINLNEVENTLSKHGYESLTLSNLNFVDQVAIFHNAEEVIGLHGAGFANIIFCKKNCKIIEIRPNTAGDVIKNLALKIDLNYYDISAKPKTINYNNQAGDIKINLEELKKKISV